MNVRIVTTVTERSDAELELMRWADSVSFAFAYMSSNRGKDIHWKRLNRSTIRYGVVGISGYCTEPFVLSRFQSRKDDRVRMGGKDQNGIFHPKLILGLKDELCRLILGSSNFTVKAFTVNSEADLYIQASADSPLILEVQQYIETEWERAMPFPEGGQWKHYLQDYRQRHKWRKDHTEGKEATETPPFTWSSDALFDYSFTEFAKIAREKDIYDKIGFLDLVTQEWMKGGAIQDMSDDGKKRMAGSKFGEFGSSGKGEFMRMILHSPKPVDEVLGDIPLRGDLSLEDAESCLQRLITIRNIALPSATRLMTLRRPDLFFSANAASMSRARELFGYMPNTISTYLAALKRLQETTWHKAPEPVSKEEKKIWRYRTALLDNWFYVPVSKTKSDA